MTLPVFDGTDIVEYEIGSGVYNVPFIDWLVDTNVHSSCTIDLEYWTREWVDVVDGGLGVASPTTDLSVVTPTKGGVKQVPIQSADVTQHNKKHTITLLAKTPSF